MNENWTDDLRRQMEQYESTEVPDGLWEGIEQCLDDSPRAVVVPMWRRMAAACIAIAIVGGAGVMLALFDHLPTSPRGGEQCNNVSATNGNLKHRDTETQRFSYSTTTNTSTALIAQSSKKLCASVPLCSDHITDGKRFDSGGVSQDTLYMESVNLKPNDGGYDALIVEDATERTSPSYTYGHTEYSHNETNYDEAVSIPYSVRKAASGRGVRVALYASQMPQSQHLGMEGYLALSANGTPDNTPRLLSKGSKGNMDYMAIANYGENPETNAHHQQPLRIGFSIGYDINRRWGISMGVAYTKLKSTLTAGTDHSYYTNDQTIDYIGVPVSASYNLLRSRYLRLYATAGGMIEFGAGGETVVETVTRNRHVATEKHELHDIPVQLSANIGGGAELRVYRGLGIFAEAGAAYYLDNNSKYTTIYSTHPLNLNLQFGVRWTINPKE